MATSEYTLPTFAIPFVFSSNALEKSNLVGLIELNSTHLQPHYTLLDPIVSSYQLTLAQREMSCCAEKEESSDLSGFLKLRVSSEETESEMSFLLYFIQ